MTVKPNNVAALKPNTKVEGKPSNLETVEAPQNENPPTDSEYRQEVTEDEDEDQTYILHRYRDENGQQQEKRMKTEDWAKYAKKNGL